jgi:hypothetical protein
MTFCKGVVKENENTLLRYLTGLGKKLDNGSLWLIFFGEEQLDTWEKN